MKKLLTVFGSITLIATTSAIVVSCEKIQQKNNDNKTDSTMAVAPKMNKEKEKNMTMPSGSKESKNAVTMTSSMPKTALMTKTSADDASIFSELYGVFDYSKERARERQQHLEETSEMVLKNSTSVGLREKPEFPKDIDHERLSSTQDLIFENSEHFKK
ncbi:hypothetical protein MFERI14815_00838 [Mycoplasma feriruminatoris]|uniref:lipoprotein n=1 Tax=Mycoplasma feriruminatoris TaxID=1179777 RepID=UPI00241D2A0E|nr:lipoprotein [Mycoplasma feriruminatoris]WFQ92221.1 hypothetical protein MFERI14815_00838 [Mycoplasma feriruminatoris]